MQDIAGGLRHRMRLLRRDHAQREQRRHNIKADDRGIGRAHAERGEQSGAGERARDARGVHGGAGHADRADQEIMRHDGRDQRAAHAEIGRPDQTHQYCDDEDVERGQIARQHQDHQRRRQHRIGRAHHRQEVAMANAVTGHAEHRGNQRADKAERGIQRQHQHRSGLDQHIPAEDQRLHLERPGGEQVGWPLKAIIPDPERGERGRPRRLAQNSMPRVIAFHPALFSCWPEIPGSGIMSAKLSRQSCRCQLWELCTSVRATSRRRFSDFPVAPLACK